MHNILSNYLINTQANKAIKIKYLAQGHKHVGTSRARTHELNKHTNKQTNNTTQPLNKQTKITFKKHL